MGFVRNQSHVRNFYFTLFYSIFYFDFQGNIAHKPGSMHLENSHTIFLKFKNVMLFNVLEECPKIYVLYKYLFNFRKFHKKYIANC